MPSTVRSTVLLSAALLVAPLPGSSQTWRTVTTSRQAAGEENLRVLVRYGAGDFRIGSADPGLLYRMELRYDEDSFEPRAQYESGRLELGVETVRKSINIGKRHSSGEMDLRLGRGVPMDLDLEFGAVHADLDLGGLSLTRLEVSTGASESTVDVSQPNPLEMERATFEVGAADFTALHLGNLNAERIRVDAGIGEVSLWFNGTWRRDARVSLKMGLGSLRLHFPEGLGVRLTKDSFLTSLDSEGLVKRGDAYYSLDWDTAEHKITIDLNAAFGSVKVLWVR